MTDKRAAGLDINADASGAVGAFAQVRDGARDMAQAVAAGTQSAGTGMEQLGQKADAAAKKQEAAQRNIIASMERYIAQTKAAGKSQAEFYTELANQRGIDTNTEAFRRNIAAIRELEAAQTSAGVSARQTAAAMRNVPAQFTDIFVSLQGGQAPLTVLLQQGGQLKDMFGGVGNATRALAGYVMGLVNPFTALAAAGGVLALAYSQGSDEALAYNRALILSGNAAGTTASQIQEMARAIAGVSGTQGAAAEALAIFAQSGAVARSNLEQFTGAAVRYASATGQAVGDIAKNFVDLAKDPLAATLKLNEGMNYLTVSTYEQIKALTDQGKTTEAATLAQEAYAKSLDERTPEMLKNLGLVERAWRGISDVAKGAWDFIKNVGRPKLLEEQLADVQSKILDRTESLQRYGNRGGVFGKTTAEQINSLREQESILQSQVREMQRGVSLKAEQAAQTKALADWDKEREKTLSDQVKLERDIARLRELGRTAKLSEKQIEDQIAEVRAKAARKESRPSGVADGELASLQARLAELRRWQAALQDGQPLEDTRTAGEKQLAVVREKLATSTTAAQRAQLAQRAAVLESIIPIEKLQQAEKLRQTGLEAQRKEEAKALSDAEKKTAALQKEIEQQQQYYEGLGLSKEQLAELAATRLEDAAAMAEQNAQTIINAQGSQDMANQYKEQARLLRDLAALKRSTAARETAIDEAKKLEDQWRRTADNIERSLTDALMRGFESGKTFAQNLRDALESMFKTLVLRPYIQAVVGGVTGLGGAAASAGQSALASSLPGLGGLGGVASYFGTGLINTLSGTGTLAGLGAASGLGGINGAAMGLGAVAPWALGAYALYSGLRRGPRVTAAENLVGSFSSAGASLSNVQQWTQKGGWLRSDRSGTISSSLNGGAIDQSLDATIASMYAKTKEYARVLGLPADAIDGYSKSINISLQGLSADERDRKIQEALAGFGDSLAQVLGAESSSALQQIAERVLSERSTLELQILNLQGNTAAIREREREAIHETNRALYDQVKALEDTKTLAQQAAAIAQERLGLQGQLDQLMGNTLALRDRERMALDESNRALYDQIKALEDARAISQSEAAVAQERVGLQGQIDQMLGNTAAIRERERMALDESNRALYDQIQALQDTKTLAEQTATAMRAQAQEREGLQGQLDLLLGNTAAIRDRERATLSESNRALYDQIKATEDAQAAAQRQTQAMQEQTAAAEQLQRAWDSIGASIRDQVTKIRTGLAAAQGQGYVALAAQFASATAQARAGDQQAASSLAGISQALLEAAAGKVTSRVEYQRIAALTAASLDATLAATGQPTPASMSALPPATGDAVSRATYSALTGLPASLAPAPVSATPARVSPGQADPLAALRAEVQSLREELAAFRRDNSAENLAIVKQTATTARVLTDVSPTGTALNTRAA